jgi:DNA-binding beta-propeller fold protein YncE
MNPSRSRNVARTLVCTGIFSACFAAAAPSSADSPFSLFESGQVRPIALSPDKKVLFAVNTPDNRLEVYRVTKSGLKHSASVPVGMEPVAVAARSSQEVWVTNHLSDSVSVVEIGAGAQAGRVVRTLLVGDEPRDIVFAGPGLGRAFITTAHRGQNVPYNPQLTTPGIGRADVWVFDANAPGASPGGNPIRILNLFSDTPRALTVSSDGSKVYAAGFHTGNKTTTVNGLSVLLNGGGPPPATNFEGIPAPAVGLIVKHNGAHWVDEIGRHWDDQINFSLPDKDVFAIDAMGSAPELISGPRGVFSGVGTILFNMAVNPVSGKVYVSNLESRNEVRFEGPAIHGSTSVRGHIAESRITVLDASGGVTPRHLNKHINYESCCAPVPNAENETSLAFPLDMVVSGDGASLYVAALGSSEVGVYSTAELENDTFIPNVQNQIHVTGGGPTGLALDEGRKRLYVLTRFDNAISILDTSTHVELRHYPMHNPEPKSVVDGRRFLYDASFSSSHGDSACASCHIFGDFDSLAWDLGNPDGSVLNNPGPFIGPTIVDPNFHPMKGPMTTQSLRGMANHGPMHWRGDRTGGNDAPSAQPESGTFDEQAAFKKFSGAFVGLLGRSEEISPDDMQAFTDFILQVTYPPNPIRALDNSLTPSQQAGFDFFFGPPSLQIHNVNCNTCHVLDRGGNPGASAPGFFGSSGMSNFDFGSGVMKVPHLRNQYQKVGMFGMPELFIFNPGDHAFQGDQVRGFGFLHDGSFDTVFRFVNTTVFNEDPTLPTGIPIGAAGDEIRRQIEDYMLVFDSNLRPIAGQQTTLTGVHSAVASSRVDLLIERAEAGECDLVAKRSSHQGEEGYLYVSPGKFHGDRQSKSLLTDAALRALATECSGEVTYTCVPPGSGVRIGIDRDGDGYLDGDEKDAGSNPADPTSTP